MKTVAIISEYNPFHTGHKHQIDKIREELGEHTRIIAIMSGNYTQRGEIAIMDKHTRAECAVRAGVNLVLELPFPYSVTSAELFGMSGVKIANSLGVVDFLSFGSELGNAEMLTEIATNMLGEKYNKALSEFLSTEKGRSIGYPKACEIVYNSLYKEKIGEEFFLSNNILALEYIKALIRLDSPIRAHTIKRIGSEYNEEKITESKHQSATAIRELMRNDLVSALNFLPKETIFTVSSVFENSKAPCDAERISSAIISHFRLNSLPTNNDIFDVGGGLYNRLQAQSMQANTINALIQSADTKKFTTARIRRAIWYSFFGVTSSEVRELPRYTQVLAMDSVGQTILKAIKKKSDFPILTKPSATDTLLPDAKKQKELSDKADFVFELTRPSPTYAGTALKTTPYIKK